MKAHLVVVFLNAEREQKSLVWWEQVICEVSMGTIIPPPETVYHMNFNQYQENLVETK